MILNKKLKNFIKLISLIFSVIALPFVSAACNPKQPKVYSVGKEWEVSDLNIKFDSFDYKSVDDYLEVQTTFIFTPLKSEFVLEKESVFIDFVNVHPINIFPNEEKSIEVSKFNIFSTISNKTTCTYVFDVPVSLFYDGQGNITTIPIRFRIYLFDGPDVADFYIDYYNSINNNQ